MESVVPFGGFFSMPSDIKSPLRISSHFGPLCHICDEKFKLEVNDVSKGGLTGSVSDHYRSTLPSWLQMSQLYANSKMNLVQNFGNLPMVAKPLYGILSDALYIGGAHRLPYISIGGYLFQGLGKFLVWLEQMELGRATKKLKVLLEACKGTARRETTEG